MHLVASASGGSAPISAMRLYVDNQVITTVSAHNLDTYTALNTGTHNVVVVAWDTAGRSYTNAVSVKAAAAVSSGSASVNIASPAASASGSPVHFVASAVAASGRSIVAMAVYLDNQLKFIANTANVDTYIAANAGVHSAVVQSWDNDGVVTKKQMQVTVGATTGGSNPPPASGTYANDLRATSNWMATQFAPSGALLYSTLRINPYYSNLAATGLLKDPQRYVQVETWMRWYIAHLNHTDRWNLGGTIYDYNIVNGSEVSTGDADSTDSYAATFLSLAYAYFATGNPAAQAYVRSIAGDLDLIAQSLTKSQQSDGLTWAKPNYQIKYLMDNAEVFRGLADASTLFGSVGDTAKQNYYGAQATKCQNGVWSMWLGNKWAIYKDGIGRLIAPNMATWYPDATAQMFPALYRVVSGSDSRAQQAYAYFNQAWPGWPQLSFNRQDPFPWVMIAGAAALVGDTGRVDAYANSVRAKWVNTGFPWTWYSMEAGWYMRVAAFRQGQGF